MKTTAIWMTMAACAAWTKVEAQTLTILEARQRPLGSTVTVEGVVTNGQELGGVRYLQDSTAGIAAYGPLVRNVQRGTRIRITGVLKDYNNLLEIDPIESVDVLQTGLPDPAPKIISIAELDEDVESQIVRIPNVMFEAAGTEIMEKSSYKFFDENGGRAQIYIRAGHPLVGAPLPSAPVELTGIASQFYQRYQVYPRDLNDFKLPDGLIFTRAVSVSDIRTDGFELSWATNIPARGFVAYGKTPALEMGLRPGADGVTEHSVPLSGFEPSYIVYARCFAVAWNEEKQKNDTAYSSVRVYATRSNSTGTIRVYFNSPVDESVATGPIAQNVGTHLDDTLVNYINRAQTTIDFAIYNIGDAASGVADIAAALNAAADRGVRVRVIYEEENLNYGLILTNDKVKKFKTPSGPDYTIMHNKFVVFDADHPTRSFVWTGSTNLSAQQVNDDPNNVIIIQDQSLAKAFVMEFEEMWGSTGAEPNPANAKLGKFKTDNTPHEFVVGGKRLQCYFSPSDGVNNRIIQTIRSADRNLMMGLMLVTREDLANTVKERVQAGISAFGVWDDTTNSGAKRAWDILRPVMGDRLRIEGTSAIFHHKYLIIDHNQLDFDPLVLTGSHNWTASADSDNDENTVIVHDPVIANLFFQQFNYAFKKAGGQVSRFDAPEKTHFAYAYPNPAVATLNLRFESPGLY
ncbi:MAG: phospholipase D-like domain-containing protein, partial [Bacteroidia bacterium]|nr:phospholipase D-like domain-containing protein [Bacteroidia bacterium]MDW8332887.1 phospholipase D-like domain-containing protein [Bacteroidia bacterium]